MCKKYIGIIGNGEEIEVVSSKGKGTLFSFKIYQDIKRDGII